MTLPKLIEVQSKDMISFALVDPEDHALLSGFHWRLLNGYAYRVENKSMIYMHVAVMGVSGIDHRNGNGLDNRRANLRTCTQSQNLANSIRLKEPIGIRLKARKIRKTTSKFRGVYFRKDRQRWSAYIGTAKDRQHLGCFDTEELAASAYDKAAIKKYGEFARPNFPDHADV